MKTLRFSIIWSLAAFLAVPAVLHGQERESRYGTVDFSISCNDSAQEAFTTGLALLHHMMYEQAESEFNRAATNDPGCAMAHWGIAMTVIHPLWGERPSDQALTKGSQAIAKAKTLAPSSEREMAYITTLETFFKDWENTSYKVQLEAFESGFNELYETYPDDIEAGAFYALGHLATAQKADRTFSHQKKAVTLLEELHRQAPEHPGLFHYIIHACDNPELAERAAEVARGYDKIAPEVPHALHMPSHIFVRLGIWPDVISWNQRSADAALSQPVGGMTSMHYAHALDYMTYAYLQRGEDMKALEVVKNMNATQNLQQNLGSAYAVAAVQTRYPLERGEWAEASTLPMTSLNGFPLDRYPVAESMIYYARGLGSARMDDLEGARTAVEALDRLHKTLTESGETYWATLTEAQRTTVEAWIAYARGERQEALALMERAADTEDSVDKHPVTPGHVLPARELLGDMLLLAGEPQKALIAYQASLELSSNRFKSLYGAGRAAEMKGDTKKAREYYTMLMDISAEAGDTRPELAKARKFLASS